MNSDKKFDLYLQFEKNIKIKGRTVKLKDAATVISPDAEAQSVCGDMIITVFRPGQKIYVMDSVNVVELICRSYKNATVTILGEDSFILSQEDNRQNLVFEYIKSAIVCLITFFGGAFAIATFNNDVEVGKLFETLSDSLNGSSSLLLIMQIAYSVGVSFGILLFYNHIKKKSMLTDPTPLEVEMRLYEQEAETAIILNNTRSQKNADNK